MVVGTSTQVAYQESAEIPGAKVGANEMLSAVHETETIGYASTEDTVATVKKEDAQFAVVPVESSTRGSYYETYDLLLKHDLAVVGECGCGWFSSTFWPTSKYRLKCAPVTIKTADGVEYMIESDDASRICVSSSFGPPVSLRSWRARRQ
jgi:hypothetical protein